MSLKGIEEVSNLKSIKTKLLSAGLWYGFANITNVFLGFIKIYIIAKVIDVHSYGIYSIVLMVSSLVSSFTAIGAKDYLVRLTSPTEEAIDTAFFLDFFRGIIGFIIMLFLAEPLSAFYNEGQLKLYLYITSLIFLITGLRNINLYKLIKEYEARKTIVITQIPIIVVNLLTIVFAILYKSIMLFIILNVLSDVLITVFSYLYYPRKFKLRLYKVQLKKQFNFAFHVYFLSVISFFLRQIDYYFVSIYFGVEKLALYMLAFKMISIVNDSVIPALMNVMYPLLSSTDNIKSHQYIMNATNITICFFIVFGVDVFFYSDNLIDLFFGDKWTGLYQLLCALVGFSMVRSLCSLLGLQFKVNNNLEFDNYASLIELFVIVLMLYPCIYFYGLNGVVLAITVAIFVRLIVLNFWANRIFKLNFIRCIKLKIVIIFFFCNVLTNIFLDYSVNVFLGGYNIVNLFLLICISIICALFIYLRLNNKKVNDI